MSAKRGVLIFSLFVATGCSLNKSENKFEKKYNIKICYLGCFNDRDASPRYSVDSLSADSIYIFIEEGFKKDLIHVANNNQILFQDTITTNVATGLGSVLTLPRSKKIEDLFFRLNNGNKAVMEIDHSMRLINLNYLDSVFIISVLKNVPVYE